MEKIRAVTLILTLLLGSFNLKAQNDNFAEVEFLPYLTKGPYTKGYYLNTMKDYVFKLYLNDKLITSMSVTEILRLKLYSTGRFSFTMVYEIDRVNGTIEINESKTYFVLIGNEFKDKARNKYRNQVVSEEIANEIKSSYQLGYSDTINLEEDINQPIGDLPKEAFSNGPGQGTAFLLDSSGYLITNQHVVEGAETITVRGISGDHTTNFEASVIASDQGNDLALLKIKSNLITFEIPPYSFQSSSAVKQGEDVFTLGYPIEELMGKEVKVTDGIINARSGYKGSISQFQFSAPIQPGNSGGPLVNASGNIIGIVTAKLNSSVTESVSYAIKSDYILFFLEQVEAYEYKPSTNEQSDANLSELVESISDFVYVIKVER